MPASWSPGKNEQAAQADNHCHTPTPFVVLVGPSDMLIIGERSRGAQN